MKIYILFHKIFTFPSLVPFITNHRVPSLLRLGAFIGLNILFGWNSNEYTTDYKLYGWLTIANGGLALLMAARSNLFSIITRIPSPILLLYHRWIGIATMIHATIHCALNIQHDIATEQFTDAVQNTRIQIGLMAWIALCIISITSIGFIRRRWFELFYYSHALFFVFVVGALIHASNGPEFLLPGLGLWVIDRAIRFANNFRSVAVKSVTTYPGDLVKLKFDGVKTSAPGQIVWIQIPGVSFFNWHPFTVASAPGSEEATVAIRGLGAYTKKVQSLVDEKKNAEGEMMNTEEMAMAQSNAFRMRVDGPYGVGGTQWGNHPVTILVAGGIGITPGISIATYIINNATKMERQENHETQSHIHLLWIVKASEHIQWFDSELRSLAATASNPNIPTTFTVTIHVTGGKPATTPSASSPSPSPMSTPTEEMLMTKETSGHTPDAENTNTLSVIHGRPDMLQWFADIKNTRPAMNAAVSVCGPRPLVDSVRKVAAKTSSVEGTYWVEEEVFEL